MAVEAASHLNSSPTARSNCSHEKQNPIACHRSARSPFSGRLRQRGQRHRHRQHEAAPTGHAGRRALPVGDAADAKETFSYVSDLPYDKVENFLLSYSTTGKADEIAVIAVKDPADVTKAADSLRAHVESRRKLFLQYGPAEAARVEKAQVFTKDQYAVLIICDDSPAVKTAFDDFLPSSDTGSD